MAFSRPTIVEIKDRIETGIETRLFGGVALLRRALLRILARVFAGAIHLLYGYLQWLGLQYFIHLCDEETLSRHAVIWNVPRRPGSFSSGTVEFTGTPATAIPLGTRIQTEEGIEYGTITAGDVGDVITVQAVEAGNDGDLALPYAGFLLQLVNSISGVNPECVMLSSFAGGSDVESADAWRLRMLQRIQEPPMGGAQNDYVRWALEVSGVGYAWCYPLAYGPGTVATVIITDDTADPVPPALLLSDVEAYIGDRKPVTAQHTVHSITDVYDNPGTADVGFNMAILPNELSYQTAVEDNLNALFQTHIPGDDILISQIRSAISNSGVTDYTINTISVDAVLRDANADIVLNGFAGPAPFAYPKLLGITFV